MTHNSRALLLSLSLLVTLSWMSARSDAAENPALTALTTLHCPSADALKSRYRHRFADPMTAWSQRELGDLRAQQVLYLFSGPDVVTPLALFPQASHLTLVADQTPEYALLATPAEESPGAAERECRMLGFFSQLGYYRTHDLNGRGGERPRFLQLLAYSIAFGGADIARAELLTINPDGDLDVLPSGSDRRIDGVRFIAKRQDGRDVTIDYLAIDLSNRGLNGHDPASFFLRHSAAEGLFLKAASHLLQSRSFSVLADLLTHPAAPWVVQDETGLGVDRLQTHYSLTLYGQYTAPQKLWATNPGARAFSDLYSAEPSRGALPFVFGYEKSAGSALIIGRRR